jgi:hypothetical protein
MIGTPTNLSMNMENTLGAMILEQLYLLMVITFAVFQKKGLLG